MLIPPRFFKPIKIYDVNCLFTCNQILNNCDRCVPSSTRLPPTSQEPATSLPKAFHTIPVRALGNAVIASQRYPLPTQERFASTSKEPRWYKQGASPRNLPADLGDLQDACMHGGVPLCLTCLPACLLACLSACKPTANRR